MDPKSPTVKPKRPYDSARRREQARQTRAAILDVAQRRFLDDGFAPTTIAAIANDAQVSVDTIYKAFGGKPGLVNAICQQALAGEGSVPAEIRSDAIQAHERDPRADHPGLGQAHHGSRPPGRPDPAPGTRRSDSRSGDGTPAMPAASAAPRAHDPQRPQPRRHRRPTRRSDRQASRRRSCGPTAHPSSTSCSSSARMAAQALRHLHRRRDDRRPTRVRERPEPGRRPD